MKKVYAVCLALVLSVALVSCASSTSGSGGTGETGSAESSSPQVVYQTVTSSESNLTLEFPDTWKNQSLSTIATVEMALLSEEYYYMVIEEKADTLPTGFTLNDYVTTVSESMSQAVENAKLSSIQDVEIAQGIKAKQFDLAGSMQANLQKIDIKYIVTCFEAEGSFYQLVAWTYEADFADAKPAFDGITNSVTFKS